MKPVRLTIEGINSFIEAQTLDFEKVGRSNLFCISGKTGAGKTTIFDSIMLALYGKSAKGNLADVVNLSLMRATVTLEFTERGEIYKVERNIKCRFEKDSDGKPTEKRLAMTDCTLYKNGEPFSKGEAANDILKDIIGLEASEFKNVYMLEQGEYAEFLKKPPAKQTEAVGKIFSLMRFGDVHKLAGEHAKQERAKRDGILKQIEELGDVSQDKLKELKDALKILRAKTTALGKDAEARQAEISALEKERDVYIAAKEKMKAVRDLMLQADETQKREYEAKCALEEFEKNVDPDDSRKLSELRERLNKLSALGALDREYSNTLKDGEVKATQLNELKERECNVRDAYEKLKTESMDFDKQRSETLAAVTATVRTRADRSAAVERVNNLAPDSAPGEITEIIYAIAAEKTEYDGITARLKETEKRIESKTRECDNILEKIERYNKEFETIVQKENELAERKKVAEEEYSAARIASHAAAVCAELHDGDKCPVCGGIYHGGSNREAFDVENKKRALDEVVEQLNAQTARRGECVKYTDMAKSEYDRSDNDRNELKREKIDLEQKAAATKFDTDLYDILKEKLEKAKSAAERSNAANDRLLKQEPEIQSIAARIAAGEQAIRENTEKADKLRSELGDLCGKTDGEINKISALTFELETKMKKIDDERKSLISAVTSATAAFETVKNSLEKAKAECPVDMPQFDEQAYTDKRDGIDRLKNQINENLREISVLEVEEKHMTEKVAGMLDKQAEAVNIEKKAKLYDTIYEYTRGKAMLNYVAAEYIAEFTAVASEILVELSSGKYTMSYDGVNGFVVSDYLNGGKSRKTDTLSGGELFLASLSVAIAIARTQSNGDNAFFFLDEGFGTLDEDLIDVVYSALESLSKDCLVGVITHAEALIARMPSCVRVAEATDNCGSRIDM